MYFVLRNRPILFFLNYIIPITVLMFLVEVIAKYCSELKVFHLELWDRVIMDVQDVDNEPHFLKLQDLKIKCEDYIEPLNSKLMKYFLSCDSSLKIVQYVGHLAWLNDENFKELWSFSILQR